MKAVDLVVSHGQRNQSGVLCDAFDDLGKVLLELIVWQIDFQDVFVILKEFFGDDDSWLEAHALIFEA